MHLAMLLSVRIREHIAYFILIMWKVRMYVHMTSFKPCLFHKRCCSNVKKSLLYHNVTLVAHSSRDDGRLQREQGHCEKLPYARRKLCVRRPPLGDHG